VIKAATKPNSSERYRFYVLANIALLLICQINYIHWQGIGEVSTLAYSVALILSQTIILGSGLALIIKLISALPLSQRVTDVFVYFIASLCALLLFSDMQLFRMYGFHINGFVINLITTPGGIESLGASKATELTFTAIALAILVAQGVLLRMSPRFSPSITTGKKRFSKPLLIFCLLAIVVGEKASYGAAHFFGNRSLVIRANCLPFYVPVTYRGQLVAMGYKPAATHKGFADDSFGSLNYPKNSVVIQRPDNAAPPNIIWITSESLRSDMLTPEIMPNTWQFAQEHASRFTNHYSGGNGTRMGMFTQFYGLPGHYWFDFFNERKPALLMDILKKQNYDIKLFSGAKFSYPEFNKTIFANIAPEHFQDNEGHRIGANGWQADQRNVSDLISGLPQQFNTANASENTKSTAYDPFMRFIFLESAHARYYFPEDSVIREPYLSDVNYATMDMERDMPLIFNRYINSVYHLDQQIGKILDHLRDNDLLKNTIVLITGDHGEAFMEKGRWGHNSEFTDEQTKVPFVLHIPNIEPRVITKTTSHIDVPATLLPVLGVTNPPSDYTTGIDLLSDQTSEFVVISDWERICLVTEKLKYYRAVQSRAWFRNRNTTRDDKEVPEGGSDPKVELELLLKAHKQLEEFKLRANTEEDRTKDIAVIPPRSKAKVTKQSFLL
jgi:membrane-anchored protein YejM (alkaline phosphatase superfamily)